MGGVPRLSLAAHCPKGVASAAVPGREPSIVSEVSTLLRLLGLSDDTRAVIVSGEGLGVSHAANSGVLDSIRRGVATTTALVVPGPWARHALAAVDAGDDVGAELTLNAEHATYRWGPITQAPSLLDGDGGFPRTTGDLWDHADLDEVRRECRAQLERAIQSGIDVTHLGSHLDALALRPEFLDIYLELAQEFALPVRLPTAASERRAGFPLRDLAASAGVLAADRVLVVQGTAQLADAVGSLEPGVTEVVLRPAIDTPELRAYDPSWPERVRDHDLAVGGQLASLLVGTTPVAYRQLREAQRRRPVAATSP